jgi:hypothetical protein
LTIKTIQHVNPADLIRSSLFNDLINNIVDLQSQIEMLSGGSPPGTGPHITSLEPAGTVQEETELKVHGTNFAVPLGLNSVTLDGTTIGSFLPGSGDTLLGFDVPAGISGSTGKTLTIVVTTPGGSDSRTVHVVPKPLTVTGQIQFTDKTGDLGTIAVDTPYVFQFELNGLNLNVAETFRIKANYSGADGAPSSEWDAATTYIGTIGPNHEVVVNPLQKITVGVGVTVPSTAKKVQLDVDFVSVHHDPASSNSSGSIPIIVGQTQPSESGAVSFTFGQSTSQNLTFGPIGNELGAKVVHAKAPIVTLNATYNVAGTYAYTRLIEFDDTSEDTTGEWTADPVQATSQAHDAGDVEQVSFKLKAPNTTPADGKQRYVRVTATRQENDATGHLSSFRRFPIEVT